MNILLIKNDKKKNFRRKIAPWLVCAALAFALGLTLGAPEGVQAADASKTITRNEMGVHNGYNYELWKDYGSTSMTLGKGGAFNCSWSKINNALFRKGLKFDQTKTHDELGIIWMNYDCDYQPNGNSYLGVYGWTIEPLVEYYILDSWGTWRPPGEYTSKDIINADGGTYEIYETTRVNQPSIRGTATFQQYWSVRTEKRTSGTISISEHFKKWESMSMEMGKMYETALVIEGYQSSGNADVKANSITVEKELTLTVNGGTYTGIPNYGQTITVTADAPDADMYFDGWAVSPDTVSLMPASDDPLKATFTMPFHDVTITAVFLSKSGSSKDFGCSSKQTVFPLVCLALIFWSAISKPKTSLY